MNRLVPVLILTLMTSACNKDENSIIWERSFGEGKAIFVSAAPESGIIAAGTLSGKPYLLKLAEDKSIEKTYQYNKDGSFTSVWADTAFFIAAGESNGGMLLTRIDNEGSLVWDTIISPGFNIEVTNIVSTSNGHFIAVGSASADSLKYAESPVQFIRFDTSGTIYQSIKTTGFDFVSVNNVTSDASGNIYLAISKKSGSQNPKALVIKYNSTLQKLWETELYNNPDYSAYCLDVAVDGSGNICATGRTEAPRLTGTLDNSFLASLSPSGTVRWKRFLENANSGAALVADNQNIIMLNRNCLIIRKTLSEDGSDEETLRVFSECDSYTTDAFGADLSVDNDGNYLAAGTLGGNFYIVLKSSH
jgi:hypothetical protein